MIPGRYSVGPSQPQGEPPNGPVEFANSIHCYSHPVDAGSLRLLVVVGFVPEGANGILKLRLARREGGALIYVGRVGTGWDHKTAAAIRRALEPLARPMSSLTAPVKKRDTTWVEPRFDAEIT